MLTAEFGALVGGETAGPLAVVTGVHVRPVGGNLTKFSGDAFGCGDKGWTVACDCGGGNGGGGNRGGNLPPRCGGGGNNGAEGFVGDDDEEPRALCDEFGGTFSNDLDRLMSSSFGEFPFGRLFSTIFLRSTSTRGR